MRAPLLALLITPCTVASADTITLTSGSTIDDVKVRAETMDTITYRGSDRKVKEVATAEVASIVYTTKPELIDQADAAAAKGDWGNAIGDLEAYLAENDEPERNFQWARDYALGMRVEYMGYVGSPAQVVEAADDVLSLSPESRYVPAAHVAKADILFLSGDAAGAKAALAPFKALIDGRGLGERWLIEHDLRGVLFDTATTGEARLSKLKSIETRARSGFPALRSRVQVAMAETHLTSGALKEAETLFKNITKTSTADDLSLAAAWYGLGRCIYERAAAKADAGEDATAEFEEAVLALLRVDISYGVHGQYLAPALYYAGRAFDGKGDPESLERAQRMYRRVISLFGDSRWAREAKAFRRR